MKIKTHRYAELVTISVTEAPSQASALVMAHRLAADWLEALANTDPGSPIFDKVYFAMPSVVFFDTDPTCAEVRIRAGATSRSVEGVSFAAEFVADNAEV